MEILTPEAAERLRQLASHEGTDLTDDDEPVASEINRLGRFARPALDYLLEQTNDPATYEAIKRLRSLARR